MMFGDTQAVSISIIFQLHFCRDLFSPALHGGLKTTPPPTLLFRQHQICIIYSLQKVVRRRASNLPGPRRKRECSGLIILSGNWWAHFESAPRIGWPEGGRFFKVAGRKEKQKKKKIQGRDAVSCRYYNRKLCKVGFTTPFHGTQEL